MRPSATPNVWRVGNLTLAAIVLGLGDLALSPAFVASAFGCAVLLAFCLDAVKVLHLRKLAIA